MLMCYCRRRDYQGKNAREFQQVLSFKFFIQMTHSMILCNVLLCCVRSTQMHTDWNWKKSKEEFTNRVCVCLLWIEFFVTNSQLKSCDLCCSDLYLSSRCICVLTVFPNVSCLCFCTAHLLPECLLACAFALRISSYISFPAIYFQNVVAFTFCVGAPVIFVIV